MMLRSQGSLDGNRNVEMRAADLHKKKRERSHSVFRAEKEETKGKRRNILPLVKKAER